MKTLLACTPLLFAPLLAAQNGLKLKSGSTTYVDVAYDASLVPQGGVTVEAWITYDEALPSGWRWPTILRQNPTAAQETLLFRVDAAQSSNRNLRFYVRGTRGALNVLWRFPQGHFKTWKHVAGTYDGTAARLYVDGKEVASRTGSVGPLRDLGKVLKIGNGDGMPIETWNGELDEVRLWPFARSAAEIMATKDLELQRVPGRVSTWNFNNSANDTSGTNNGKWVGATQYATNTLKLKRFPVSGAFNRGAATVGCRGTSVLTIGSIAEVGNTAFALASTRGAPSSASVYVLAAKLYTSPIKILGVDLWTDVSSVVTVLGLPTNSLGTSRMPLPIPNDAKFRNVGLATQVLHLDASCSKGAWSSSPALTFSVR